ncbi:hypothetical protein [Limnoglobus roseus]|uniref:Uncharacterized protein n=1 Tax=Limnoglobus roseus TaxID=2598579 RepID=A0A5C1A7A3_9BACT|nr:hypothetical protein [Limnoglobus roseus]QEL14325.1 hypothetical protein PX52LOC_01205 [Limnoglobus roseus]
MAYRKLMEADREVRTANRIARSRDIAQRELRYKFALKGQTPTDAELQAAADDAERRERQGDDEKRNDGE